jgi:hypothetical protein
VTRKCSTCQHIKRAEVDRRLAAGEPGNQIARDYDLNPSSLHRHRTNCLGLSSSNAIMKEVARGTAAIIFPNLIAIRDAHELPQELYGSARASALALIDRHYDSEGLIIADLSYDPTYAEPMHETFGPRVIGLQISRHGDGMNFERRPVKNSAMLVYTVGRSHLLELYHSLLQSGQVRIADRPTTRRAYEQLMALKHMAGKPSRKHSPRQRQNLIERPACSANR